MGVKTNAFQIQASFPEERNLLHQTASIMKRAFQMDQLDRRIVSLLQEDATLTHADLADRCGASAASCWRRVKALEAAGILTRCVRLVDPHKVGRGVNVLCNIRMRSHALEDRRSFETFVDTRPEIIECFSMSGDWDYLLRVAVADVADYNMFLMKSLLSHPAVAGGSSHFALSMTKYTTALPV